MFLFNHKLHFLKKVGNGSYKSHVFFCLSDNSQGFQVDNLRMRRNSSPFLNRHVLVRKRFLWAIPVGDTLLGLLRWPSDLSVEHGKLVKTQLGLSSQGFLLTRSGMEPENVHF